MISHDEVGGPGHFGPVIRERGYETELANYADGVPPRHPITEYAGVIMVGAAAQVDEDDLHAWIGVEKQAVRDLLDADIPYLGVCFGGQLLAHVAGGHVGPTDEGRHGWHRMKADPEAASDPIFGTLSEEFTTYTWHLYHFELPPEAVPLSRSATCLQAFRLRDRRAWGMQFHPEMSQEVVIQSVDWIRAQRFADMTESVLDGFLEDNQRYGDDQKRLAEQIVSAFLDEVERKAGQPDAGAAASGVDSSSNTPRSSSMPTK